jgi:hypothetical protein
VPLRGGKTRFRGGVVAEYRYDVAGFSSATQKPSVEFKRTLSADDFDEALFTEFTLPAAGTQTIDFRLFQTLAQQVTGASAIGIAFRLTATVAGGQLRVAPGAAQPLTWFFGSATDSLTINATADGEAGFCLLDGTAVTVSDSARNLDCTNPGSAAVTVRVMAIVGN